MNQNECVSEDQILYRRYTTRYYGSGDPHPLKAPDEIRRRMLKSSSVWHSKMKRALKYAERRKREWIAKLKSEEKYLRAAGWTTEPFEHDEYMGDHDTWVSPRRQNCHGYYGPYVSEKGSKMSRMGAMSKQCEYDGHVKKKNVRGPLGIPLICCSRCGAAFAIRSSIANR